MNEILFPNADKEAERRRALAKVYSLLLRLAEEAKAKRETSSNATDEEKTQEASIKS